ncbi:MAG: MEDS domain-containing protein [Thermoguttaceae bacterium]|jgi:PAS domain S-box-containing protein
MTRTGIDVIGDVPWGTHFCQFYQTKQDLVDILVPYFREGLHLNELCMWITSEPLNVDDAKAALRQAVPDLDNYLRRGQIEILDYGKWYTATGKFGADRVLQGWIDKEKYARGRGYEGLRLTGNIFWLEKQDWKDFSDYEAVVNEVIGNYRMLAICTYFIDKCGATELIDVVSNHQFALIKQSDQWKIIESRRQRRVETALRESEHRYQSLVELSPLAIAVHRDGKYIYVNPACVRLFGASRPEELLDKYVLDFVHPDDRQAVAERIQRIQNTGIISLLRDSKIIRLDGAEIQISSSGTVINYDGRPAVQAVMQDNTQRKRAEEALQKANERLEQSVEERTADLRTAFLYARNLLEASLDPLVTISPGGQIMDVNKATEVVTGVVREKLIGSDFSAYFTDPKKADEGYRAVLSQGSVTDYPLTIRHTSGCTTDVLYNAAVYRNEAGAVQGVFAAAHDVTEHNRMDKELQALHKALEHRAAQLQSLASELTLTEHRERRRLAQLLHDHLQQLLYAARLSVTILKRRVPDKELQNIIQHLDMLLGQCIEESRSVTLELSPPVLYDAGLTPALEWLARQMQLNYGLLIKVHSDVQTEPEAEDIKVLLFQSVRELLFNVVKHAGAQCASVKMSLTPDQQVRIDVEDKGAGFNAEQMQVNGNGITGLGLFSIRERLEQMGGRLEVHTGAGQGTSVSIFAPCHRQQSSVGEGAAIRQSIEGTLLMEGNPALLAKHQSDIPTSRKIRVLLADDHTVLRKGLVGVLNQEADIEVVAEASDGEMAVELARQFNPDVVLMDVTMPKVDGIEATRRITAAQLGVGVIGYSAHKEEDLAQALYKAGAIGYLSKDEPAEFLIAAIRNLAPRSADGRLKGGD